MKMKNLFGMALLSCFLCMTLTFVACGSSDDEQVATYSYKVSFSTLSEMASSSDTSEGLTSSDVTKAYLAGIGSEKVNFTLTGTQSVCDAQVLVGCEQARTTLQGQTSKIDATLEVWNMTTSTVLHTASFVKGDKAFN